MSVFKVVGVSTLNGVTKVRFANDFVSRVKILNKQGHTDIDLMELPEALTKAECVKHLKTTNLYESHKEAIDNSDVKYNYKSLSQYNSTVKVSAPSLDELRARAIAETEDVVTEQDLVDEGLTIVEADKVQSQEDMLKGPAGPFCMISISMSDSYTKWSKNNTLGLVPIEPTELQFATTPWEGELGYNNIGQIQQYQNGKWRLK